MIHHSSLKGAGVFTPEYELVLKENGQHMLFDRLGDPEQTSNLIGWADHEDVFQTLKDRIVRHHNSVGSPAAAWLGKL